MIRVFQPTDTTSPLVVNVVLRPLRAKVHKEDNNDFYLDMGWNKTKGDKYYFPNEVIT